MVKVAIAGGSGEVAREILDALVAANRHEITILTRKHADEQSVIQRGVTWRQVNYEDKQDITKALGGIHTVLSFVQLLHDQGNRAQRNLIDAAVLAGVKRFAPSEWGSNGSVLPLWAGKDEIRQYLRKVNEKEKVLEYTLFQPGLFLNYLATPHKTSAHVTPLNTFVDFHYRRAITVDGHDPIMAMTTVKDLAAVVARAVDFEGEWPAVGGIRGNRVRISQIIAIGERIRGSPFKIDTVKREDLETGNLTASWTLETRHHAVSDDEAAAAFKGVLVTMLLSSANGAWDGPDEWNQRLPDYKFTDIEEFLRKVWEGKP